jgi:hypothetical protein
MLKLNTECMRSKTNYSSCTVKSRENIYAAVAVETLGKKKKRQDETPFTTKIDGFKSFIPHCMLMYLFAGFFFESHPVYDQTLLYR